MSDSYTVEITIPTIALDLLIRTCQPNDSFDYDEEKKSDCGNFITYTLFDCKEGVVEFIQELLNSHIPFDQKHDGPNQTVCVRYQEDLKQQYLTYDHLGERTVSLRDVEEAHLNGTIQDLLKNEYSKLMDWEDQLTILKARNDL